MNVKAVDGRNAVGFTLVELLVSLAVVSIILVIGTQMVNNVSRLATQTRARVETFQEARAAYESMTRKLSQAMLNTYWDYDYPNGDHTKPPSAYARQSELHFICSPSRNGDSKGSILKPVSTIQTTGHAVFFQAPQGYSSPLSTKNQPKNLPNLASLLNASGFYLDYASDINDRPDFLKSATVPAERWRFRLMELEEPTESLQIYFNGTTAGKLNSWFLDPVTKSSTIPLPPNTPLSVRMMAENVVEMVLLPHRSPNDTPTASRAPQQLAPQYIYDSRRYLSTPSDPVAQLWRNQLPPLIQVTMVVLDEKSAARLRDSLPDKTVIPIHALQLDKLFIKPSSDPNVTATSSTLNDQYFADLATLEATLTRQKLTYRVFTSDVSILQAKWSED